MDRNIPSQSRQRSVSLTANSSVSAQRRSSSISSSQVRYQQGQRRQSNGRLRADSYKRVNGSAKAILTSAPTSSSDRLTDDRCKSVGDVSDDDSLSSDIELDPLVGENGVTDDEEVGLATDERKRRRRRKRRNTRLDERIATITHANMVEKQVADTAVARRSIVNVMLIGLWYLFSILISLYNKWMFSPDKLNFSFPLFTTGIHMIVQFTCAGTVLYFLPQLRPRRYHPNLQNSTSTLSQQSQESHASLKPIMSKWFYLTRLGPCGAATALDIGLGNMSLKHISLTFYTMCKSSSLGFVLIFAFLFRLEKPSWKLTGVIAIMTVGVTMMVFGESKFNMLGFILIMLSALSAGFRWSLTQILLLRHPATANPFSSIFLLAPVMFLSLVTLAIPVEGISAINTGLEELLTLHGTNLGIAILLFPGFIAFLMTSAEFALLKRTSVVTLSICGIFKEVLTVSAASITFHDQLTPINALGLVVTIVSIAAYNFIKVQKMRADARLEAHKESEQHHYTHSGQQSDADDDYDLDYEIHDSQVGDDREVFASVAGSHQAEHSSIKEDYLPTSDFNDGSDGMTGPITEANTTDSVKPSTRTSVSGLIRKSLLLNASRLTKLGGSDLSLPEPSMRASPSKRPEDID